MEDYNGFEIKRVVAKYHVFQTDAGCPSDMTVEIFKTNTHKFTAECNYSFWSIGQANAYQHDGFYDTEEQALKSVLNSLKMFNKGVYSDTQYCWVPKQYTGYVVLGSRELATRSAFQKQNFTNKIGDIYC
jgi:hypothetical protein